VKRAGEVWLEKRRIAQCDLDDVYVAEETTLARNVSAAPAVPGSMSGSAN